MENAVNAVNYYKQARQIFYNMNVGNAMFFSVDEGRKVRAALHVLIQRNPHEQKQFKTKIVGDKLKIWRKI